jgi:hypothetical protein
MAATGKNIDIDMVVAALESCSSNGVAGAAKMLASGLKHAASTPVGERHRFQDEFLELVRSTLHEGENDAERRCEASVEKISTETVILEGESTVTKTALSAVLEATKAVGNAEQTATSRKEEYVKARAATIDPEELNQELLARKNQLKQESEHATNVAEGSLNMLRQGGWHDDEVHEAALAAVSDLLGSSSAEATLAAAVPHALGKKPEQRQEFDKIIEEAAAAVIAAVVKKRQAELTNSEQEAEDANAEALGLQVIAEFAEEAAAAADADVTSVKEALAHAEKAKLDADEAVAMRQQGIEEIRTEKERLVETVSQLRESMLSLARLTAGDVAPSDGAVVEVDMEPPPKKARTQEDTSQLKENCPVDTNIKATAREPLKVAGSPLGESVVIA